MTKAQPKKRVDFTFRLHSLEPSDTTAVLEKFGVPVVAGVWYRVWTRPVNNVYRCHLDNAISARKLSRSEVTRMGLY